MSVVAEYHHLTVGVKGALTLVTSNGVPTNSQFVRDAAVTQFVKEGLNAVNELLSNVWVAKLHRESSVHDMVRVRFSALHTRKPVLSVNTLGIVVFKFFAKVGSCVRLIVPTLYFRSDKRRMVFLTKRKNIPPITLSLNDVPNRHFEVVVVRWLCHTY
jgi:hypothetical protein